MITFCPPELFALNDSSCTALWILKLVLIVQIYVSYITLYHNESNSSALENTQFLLRNRCIVLKIVSTQSFLIHVTLYQSCYNGFRSIAQYYHQRLKKQRLFPLLTAAWIRKPFHGNASYLTYQNLSNGSALLHLYLTHHVDQMVPLHCTILMPELKIYNNAYKSCLFQFTKYLQ